MSQCLVQQKPSDWKSNELEINVQRHNSSPTSSSREQEKKILILLWENVVHISSLSEVCFVIILKVSLRKKKHTLHTVYFNPQVQDAYQFLFLLEKKKKATLRLFWIFCGWLETEDTSNFFLNFFFVNCFALSYRHLILNISNLNFNGKKRKKKKKENMCKKKK